MTLKCKNYGCTAEFKWSVQLTRHKKKCSYITPEVRYVKVNSGYQCKKCSKTFRIQASISRHVKTECVKERKLFRCDQCQKEFPYKSLLDKHKLTHTKPTFTCGDCKRKFRKKNNFLTHKCVQPATPVIVEDSFVPSFAFNESPSDDINELSIEENTSQPDTSQPEQNTMQPIDFGNDLVTEIQDPVLHNQSTTENERTAYWRDYKVVQRKSLNLEKIVQSLSSPIKHRVCENLFPNSKDNVNTYYDGIICEGIMKHLKELWDNKKYMQFHKLLYAVCGEELLVNDERFSVWLCGRLDVQHKHARFITYIRKAIENKFIETRGRNPLSPEFKQNIYDIWLENSIPSTDGRNGRNIVSIAKEQFQQKFGSVNSSVHLEEKLNRRGKLQIVANRLVLIRVLIGFYRKI